MLGEAETREVLAERGQVDVTCEYCGRRREFDPIDISRLFTDNAVAGPESLQ
jgi:molecular chaperone Hsp33